MQLHIQTDKEKVIVLAEVAKIEVKDILSPDAGDELYFRRIRFVTRFGEAKVLATPGGLLRRRALR